MLDTYNPQYKCECPDSNAYSAVCFTKIGKMTLQTLAWKTITTLIIPPPKYNQALLYCADRCKSDVLHRHGLNQGFGITGSQ